MNWQNILKTKGEKCMPKKKLLLVDDTVPNLKLLGNMLQDIYSLSFATSGAEALKILEKSRPDLILLDIMMPGMDGFEVCKRIKSNPVLAPIPILFITAKADKQSVIKSYELGGQGYILKPFEKEEVTERIAKVLPGTSTATAGRAVSDTANCPLFCDNRTQNTKLYFDFFKNRTCEKLDDLEDQLNTITRTLPLLTDYISHMEELILSLDTNSQNLVKDKLNKVNKDKTNPDLTGILHTLYEDMQNNQFKIVDLTSEIRAEDYTAGVQDVLPVSMLKTLVSAFPENINFEPDEFSNPYVVGSEERFMQVLLSLIDNAMDAARFRNTEPAIVISMERADKELKITLQDNGGGFLEDNAHRISQPFFTTRKNHIGLGLTAVEILMKEEFKGNFSIINSENGCLATLTFPQR